MRKLATALLCATLAAAPVVAEANDTYRHLQWEYEQQKKQERENGYPNSGYSNGECGWGCKVVVGGVLAALLAAIAAEQAKKQRLQQQRGY